MAVNISSAADLQKLQKIAIATAKYTYEHIAVMRNLVTGVPIPPGHKQVNVPKFGILTVASLQEGVPISESQSLTVTDVVLTTSEVGGKVVITRRAERMTTESLVRVASKLLGNAMGKKIDQDLLALLDGFGNVVGDGSTDITIDHIRAAISQLYGQSEPAPMPLVCVLHPYQIDTLVNLIATPAYNVIFMPEGLQMDILRDYWRGNEKLFNVPIFSDGNLTIVAGDAKGGVFSKEALALALSQEPSIDAYYDHDLRADCIIITADYKGVELDDAYGRELYFNAAIPTS